jgi:hypothetical protein
MDRYSGFYEQIKLTAPLYFYIAYCLKGNPRKPPIGLRGFFISNRFFTFRFPASQCCGLRLPRLTAEHPFEFAAHGFAVGSAEIDGFFPLTVQSKKTPDALSGRLALSVKDNSHCAGTL